MSRARGLCTHPLQPHGFLHARHLALSTNNIEKIAGLSGMESLRILSIGRNVIKKIENLDAVAETLEELWISYNNLTSLVGHAGLAAGTQVPRRCRARPCARHRACMCARAALRARRCHPQPCHALPRCPPRATAGCPARAHAPPHTRPSAAPIAQAGIEKASNLKTLFMSNNKIADLREIDRLSSLAQVCVRVDVVKQAQ